MAWWYYELLYGVLTLLGKEAKIEMKSWFLLFLRKLIVLFTLHSSRIRTSLENLGKDLFYITVLSLFFSRLR